MILHLFNSSSVSGPERLVAPSLARRPGRFMVANLLEDRLRAAREADPLGAHCRSLGLPYAAVPVAGRWDPDAIRGLRDLLERARPELVHAHSAKASVYLARAARGLRPAPPLVSTHHGVRGLPDARSRLYELVYRRLFLRPFDRVLCVSTEDYAALRGSGVAPGRLRLHLNGVEGDALDAGRRRAEGRRSRALWLPGEAGRDALFLLGAVGRLSPEKGHRRLLKVLARLRGVACRADWRCLVFGAGALEGPLREDTLRMGLARWVRWMGYRAEIGRELAGLDLLVSFSRAEGLPVSLLEAGWAGTPVMSTLVGGVRDLIPDGRYGAGVPPDEAPRESARRLAALMSGGGRAALARAGMLLQQRVREGFSGARWTARLAEVYAELGVSF